MSEAEAGAAVDAAITTRGLQLDGGHVEKRVSGTKDPIKEATQQGPSNTAPKRAWFKKAEKKLPTEEELQEAEKKKKAAEAATFGNYLVPTIFYYSLRSV